LSEREASGSNSNIIKDFKMERPLKEGGHLRGKAFEVEMDRKNCSSSKLTVRKKRDKLVNIGELSGPARKKNENDESRDREAAKITQGRLP